MLSKKCFWLRSARVVLRWASTSPRPYFLTTPIFYVNATPHLGHVYTGVLADAQARFQRLRGRSVHLCTGTDEHGFKVERAARTAGQTPADFCGQVSEAYRSAFALMNIQADDFVRTSEARHAEVVRWLWTRLEDGGHLKKATYGGWYCVPDETFLSELQTDVRKGVRVSLESGHPVEWEEETNYVFDLAAFKPSVRRWLDDQSVIQPSLFRGLVESSLSDDSLETLSVSRSASRCQWGIPVPGDPSQVIYVWLDALANYLTTAGDCCRGQFPLWPPDEHLVGKDILKFHAVYWPAFLMAADLELPRRIRVHSHWLVDNNKMSKSKGNVVDPVSLTGDYTGEGVRYFLLREGVPHSDGNYSERKMINYLNAELANTLGNLLSRCTAKTLLDARTESSIENHVSQQAKDLLSELQTLPGRVAADYGAFEYYKGVDSIMAALRRANGYINDEKPWELKTSDKQRLDVVLRISLETLRVCAIVLQPIVPTLTASLLDKLGVDQRQWSDAEALELSHSVERLSSHKCVLFKRVKFAREG